MNRREFLKSALTIAALAPVTRLAAGTGADGDKTSDAAEGAQVTRRRYKNTALTVPLLGFGCMAAAAAFAGQAGYRPGHREKDDRPRDEGGLQLLRHGLHVS